MAIAAPLEGKIALVTGASRGIGRAIALRLARQGATVCVHYGTQRARALDAVGEIVAAGGSSFAVGADLTDLHAIAGLFKALDEALAARGTDKFDILVNNAGVGRMGDLVATDEAMFDRLLDTNVKGTFFVTQQALPRLRDGGRIITISSMVALAAYSSCIAYAMSKAALHSFTRSLAAELGTRRITVNAVAPGATDTDFISGLKDDQAIMAAVLGGTALGRLGETADIDGVVAFLASADGGWITGQVLAASGGMHL